MRISRRSQSIRTARLHPAIAAAFFMLLGAISLRAQDGSPSPGSLEPARETVDFEGIRIVFPKEEADVVEQMKPALRKFREERKQAVQAEAKDIADSLSDDEMKEAVRKLMLAFIPRKTVSQQFDARWESQTVTMQKLARAWAQWSGDISELQLWRRDELAPFQTRPDGSDDPEGFSHRFPQISFGKKGARFSLKPPFLVPLPGLDLTLKLTNETKSLRLDIPLFYKPGESPEQIAKFGRDFLGHLPTFIHDEYVLNGLGLTAAIPRWTFEYMFLGEIEAVFVERGTAEGTALADGLARLVLFAEILKQNGEAKTMKEFSRLFPYAMGGWDISDPAAILTTLEKLDPLAKVERGKVTERLFARNLIAVTLIDIAQKDDTKSPIFQKLKKAGVAIPAGGFTMESFIAAVDRAYGEDGFFLRALKARQATTLEQLRESVARREKLVKDVAAAASKTPAAPVTMPGRLSAKFGALTITFPPELKAAVEIVGPEYAKVLATARAAMEALCKKGPGPVAVEVTDADAVALRAYGLEPDANVLRGVAIVLGAMQDKAQVARWFVSGERMQIWIKEDLLAFLKGGGVVPDMELSQAGDGGTWNFRFAMAGNFLNADKTTVSDAEASAEIVKRIDAIPHAEYPIIFKRETLPAKLDDPAAVAAAIRAGEREIFAVMRTAVQDPAKAAADLTAFIPQFSPEQWWFVATHEISESAIVREVIASADRRWFCDGMANWIAIREVDRRFGAGKGAEAFAKNYDAAEMRKHAAKVNLLAWPVAEDVDSHTRPDVENPPAHYFFATLVIEKACEGRDAEFVKSWLEEIRKTPRNRANNGTVIAAYRKLTGNDLEAIVRQVVR